MDDSSPYVRITRGTPFFVKVVDNLSSFSIRLTQDFGVNAGSMEKAKQVQVEKSIEELRYKKKMTQSKFRKTSTLRRLVALKLLKEEV
ncbi:hypothetical protein H5410_047208 [Solanum commersonii]|uniref:Uncharacterized protein n=1 Tax=Solanum commersonii TaxID=4109 RepID=A0A9J5XHZ2_SOLCO|nr:hypothetical protein H5410_047208 [Solanum commersonii]